MNSREERWALVDRNCWMGANTLLTKFFINLSSLDTSWAHRPDNSFIFSYNRNHSCAHAHSRKQQKTNKFKIINSIFYILPLFVEVCLHPYMCPQSTRITVLQLGTRCGFHQFVCWFWLRKTWLSKIFVPKPSYASSSVFSDFQMLFNWQINFCSYFLNIHKTGL